MTYSSSLALGRQRFAGKHQNTTSLRSGEAKLGPVSNSIILVILACLLGLLYLTQVTKTNVFGYKIDALQKEQVSLERENDELQVSAARLQSLQRVKDSEVAKNLVSVAPSGAVNN